MSTLPTATFAEIALSLPLDQTFSYEIPSAWSARVKLGQRVLVPFGSRKLTGHIVGFEPAVIQPLKMKPILEILDEEPLFGPSLLDFLKWVAKYYHAPLGEVLRAATPPGINLKSLRLVT